ncbi:MAG: hypothetical protein AB1405_08460 [Bdellovibrionota bacterium]
MKKILKRKDEDPDMLPEYDFSGAVRGLYPLRFAAEAKLRKISRKEALALGGKAPRRPKPIWIRITFTSGPPVFEFLPARPAPSRKRGTMVVRLTQEEVEKLLAINPRARVVGKPGKAVYLESDLAEQFPDSSAVNEALRSYLKMSAKRS